MRLLLQVQRSTDPYATARVGRLASRLLSLVRDVSEIRIERELCGTAMLSFEDHDRLDSFSEIDRVLGSRGMRRLETGQRQVADTGSAA